MYHILHVLIHHCFVKCCNLRHIAYIQLDMVNGRYSKAGFAVAGVRMSLGNVGSAVVVLGVA